MDSTPDPQPSAPSPDAADPARTAANEIAEGPGEVRESVDIQAPAAEVWPLVSDPMNYPLWSPEATGTHRLRGEGSWQVGDTFRGTNKAWLPWSTGCTVEAADLESGFVFRVSVGPFPVARWGYRVVATGPSSCRVTETWQDARSGWRGALVKPSGLLVGRGWDAATRNRRTMRATLAALKAHAEAGS